MASQRLEWTFQRFSEEGGLTCASNATPLVISSNADVASGEKRSSPDEGDFKYMSEQQNEQQLQPFNICSFQTAKFGLGFKTNSEEKTNKNQTILNDATIERTYIELARYTPHTQSGQQTDKLALPLANW